jgi:hypothetical protein
MNQLINHFFFFFFFFFPSTSLCLVNLLAAAGLIGLGLVLGSALTWALILVKSLVLPYNGALIPVKSVCLRRYPTVKPVVLGVMQKNILNGIAFKSCSNCIIIHMSRLEIAELRLLYNQLKVAMFLQKKVQLSFFTFSKRHY